MTGISGRTAMALLASSALTALAAGTAQAQDAAAPATAAAPAAEGTITGRVYDAATGKSLHGAIVRVAGTNAQEEVPALATGAGADRVRGYFPNTHLFTVMMDALGWQPD